MPNKNNLNKLDLMGVCQNFLKINKVYKPCEINEVMEQVTPFVTSTMNNKGVTYLEVPCSFDIENTSFFRLTGNGEQEKCAIMYEWSFSIFGLVVIGRTWDEYIRMISTVSRLLSLSGKYRLICYCHNLAWEFQFMRKWFKWSKVFAIENHRPIYAICDNGIEYRCSLILSGYSLAKVAENLHSFEIKKLVGDLDYSLMRHSKTPLTDEEIAYCVNDVKIVIAYIAECIIDSKSITKIPLTKTGYVRNFCRNSCFYTPGIPREVDYKRKKYLEIMHRLRVTVDEYQQLERAFQGGFTHANSFYEGKTLEDITSYDFTSSYPCVMIAEQFPMSSSERIDNIPKKEFYKSLSLYCCVFDIEFIDIKPKVWFEHYISASRCWVKENCQTDNGRVVKADRICTTITEQDFLIIRKFYDYKGFTVSNFRRYKKGYLPTDFVKAILKLYRDKTTLKNVPGKEVEYLQSKEMLNSCYGMSVTSVVREEFIYKNGHWLDKNEKPQVDYKTAIDKYNNSNSRFLFWCWGCWVTAYARRNLFSGIFEFAGDYVYSDTDSIKVRNEEKHKVYLNEYNRRIREQLYHAMDYHKLLRTAIEPKTIKGEKKCLGLWDFDGHYAKFKTLGAKRYMVTYSDDERNSPKDRGKTNITVAGLNKQKCVPWMIAKWGEEHLYEHFNDNLTIPKEYTGKNVHTYIEDEKKGVLTDYTGIASAWYEKSAVHLDSAEYSLKISKEYADYLLSIRTEEW